jgi:hypothetical protein
MAGKGSSDDHVIREFHGENKATFLQNVVYFLSAAAVSAIPLCTLLL